MSIYTNYMIDQFMSQSKNTDIEDYFDNEELEEFNSKIKNGNKYAIDYFGIPIRRKEMGQCKPNGWIQVDGHIYHHLVNRDLIGLYDDEYIRDQTIDLMKQKYPKLFSQNTVTNKIIHKLYGN